MTKVLQKDYLLFIYYGLTKKTPQNKQIDKKQVKYMLIGAKHKQSWPEDTMSKSERLRL